jgi:hypothetical protein
VSILAYVPYIPSEGNNTLIKFYEAPVPTEMQVYNGETGGRDWNNASYSIGLPTDWAANNTQTRIKTILQSLSSRFALPEGEARTTYMDVVKDTSTEIIVVLKGIHQYKDPKVGSATAHITVAWFTYLYHLNVAITGTGSGITGVASLGVRTATAGEKSVSSTATGWTAVGKGGKTK